MLPKLVAPIPWHTTERLSNYLKKWVSKLKR